LTLNAVHLTEPLLEFAFGQRLEAPKDGLFLFGPVEDSGGRNLVRVGVVGTSAGIGFSRLWFKRLSGWIPAKLSKQGRQSLWAPAWPGFEACFGIALPERGLAEIILDGAAIEACIKRENRSDAVRSTVRLFADAIRDHIRAEEKQPDVWLIVVPDVVYRYGRPQVAPPPKAERVASNMVSAASARRFFKGGDLFPETMVDAETYLFANNFHHQIKAELLPDTIALQLVLESTLTDRSIVGESIGRKRGLQDEATIAWNFSTTLYFKTDAKPWALADVLCRADVSQFRRRVGVQGSARALVF
jgi:hypothetical protein